jgi:hypothetical protein
MIIERGYDFLGNELYLAEKILSGAYDNDDKNDRVN